MFKAPAEFQEQYFIELMSSQIDLIFYKAILASLEEVHEHANQFCTSSEACNMYDFKTVNKKAYDYLITFYNKRVEVTSQIIEHYNYFLKLNPDYKAEFTAYYKKWQSVAMQENIGCVYSEEIRMLIYQFYDCDWNYIYKLITGKMR
jgi:hypothetical protein